jgi:hypothetical protein
MQSNAAPVPRVGQMAPRDRRFRSAGRPAGVAADTAILLADARPRPGIRFWLREGRSMCVRSFFESLDRLGVVARMTRARAHMRERFSLRLHGDLRRRISLRILAA